MQKHKYTSELNMHHALSYNVKMYVCVSVSVACMCQTHSLMSLSCSYSCGFVKSGSWASRWIMYGTTYSGRRETSFSEGKGRMTRFNINKCA